VLPVISHTTGVFFYGENMILFENCMKTEGQQISLDEFLTGVQSGRWDTQIQTLRALTDEAAQKDYKRKYLPAVGISCDFSGTRAAKNAINHTGIMQIDIDGISEPQKIKEMLSKDPHVVFCCISPRGHGVKAGVRMPADTALHKEAHQQFKEHLNNPMGWDDAVKDVSRLFFVCSDSEMYINLKAEEFEVVKRVKVPDRNITPVKCDRRAEEKTAQKTMDTLIKNICTMSAGDKHRTRLQVGYTIGGGISAGYWTESEAIGYIQNYVEQTSTRPAYAMKCIRDSIEAGKAVPLEPSRSEVNIKKARDVIAQKYREETGEEPPEDLTKTESVFFRPLGMTSEHYVIYNVGKGCPILYNVLDKKALLDLADLEMWIQMYSEDGESVKWDQAVSDTHKRCKDAGFYDPTKIRGRGIWREKSKFVVNTGTELYCNGAKVSHQTYPSQYVYRKAKRIDIYPSISPIHAGDSLIQLFRKCPFDSKQSADIFAGWICSALISGALMWRPHMWLVAPAQSGKTWILEHIVSPILGDLQVGADGQDTTEAGIRQRVGDDALVITHEEAEGKSEKGKRNLESKLMLMRQSSSEISVGGVLKGSTSGKAQTFNMRCSWLFLSTKIPQLDTADDSRILKCSLVPASKRVDAKNHFASLQDSVKEIITSDFCNGLLARMLSVIPFFDEAVGTFSDALSPMLKTRRDVDNLAPIMAALWFLQNDSLPDIFDAGTSLIGYDFSHIGEDNQTEEEKCINTIMQIIPYSWDRNIGAAMMDAEASRDILANIGIAYSKRSDSFYIEARNATLRGLLKDTPYYDTYASDLASVDGAEKGIQKIGGRACRCIVVPARAFFGDTPVGVSSFFGEEA